MFKNLKTIPLDDDKNVMGGLNHIPHLVKQLMIVTMFHIFKTCAAFVNPNFNLGVQFETFSN